MRTKMRLFLGVFALLVTGLVGVASASNRVDLIKNDTIKIEAVLNQGHQITRVFVYNENNKLVITGRIDRKHSAFLGNGHVDIAIVSPEGETLSQVSTYYIPRHIRKNPSRGSRFEVRLPSIPKKGSTIRIVYHKASKSASRIFQCGSNMAVKADS